MMSNKSNKILAVASAGGHWEQLMLIAPAFENLDVQYVSTDKNLSVEAHGERVHFVVDCNRDRPLSLIRCLFQCVGILWKVRPTAIVSTGAAPGIICILAGRLLGVKTIWIDSFANSESLSMSGKLACRIADVSLTQWEHLTKCSSATYKGAIL